MRDGCSVPWFQSKLFQLYNVPYSPFPLGTWEKEGGWLSFIAPPINRTTARMLAVSIHWCVRPYYREYTWTRPISEVKPGQAQLVLRWATTWEHWVLYAFYPPPYHSFFSFSKKIKGIKKQWNPLFKKSFTRLKKILPTPLHSALVGNSPSIFGRRRFLGTLSECLFFFGIYSFHFGGLGRPLSSNFWRRTCHPFHFSNMKKN